MEIVFLNTFHGRIREPIKNFLTSRVGKTDVFCFQEIYDRPGDMKEIADQLLSGYISKFAYKGIAEDDYSQATYVSSQVSVIKSEVLFPTDKSMGLGIVTEIEANNSRLSICNFHGRAYPGNKLDSPERIVQSQKILDYFKSVSGPKIIGGDFNLDLDTHSVRMFAEAGYRNLIVDYGIKTTRNRIIWEKYPTTLQYYSDYIFVSPEVKVTSLEVPENEISDHLPMILHVE